MNDLHINSNFSTADVNSGSDAEVNDFIAAFLERFKSESEKNQLQLVQDIASKGETGLKALMNLLSERSSESPSGVDGKAFQILLTADNGEVQQFLQTHFPQGLVKLRSQNNIDYSALQTLLAKQDFEAADRLTLEKMCELAGETAKQRRWLYFTEVEQFPSVDLQTINTLWLVYSQGLFGFSVQRDLWIATGRNWEKLWPLIGWKKGNNWTRYPNEFTWDLSAPKGHLPLSNQLRGVRVMNSLLTHPAWTERS